MAATGLHFEIDTTAAVKIFFEFGSCGLVVGKTAVTTHVVKGVESTDKGNVPRFVGIDIETDFKLTYKVEFLRQSEDARTESASHIAAHVRLHVGTETEKDNMFYHNKKMFESFVVILSANIIIKRFVRLFQIKKRRYAFPP